ncbi:hypothetical protein BW716_09310 [[Flexibacter] sp. ATCC 35208]|nr:hypothetical protein BW716_09310 [[Flexibacter] sp. ATCC 35208]
MQWLGWGLICIFLFTSLLSMNTWQHATFFSLYYTSFYAIVIYTDMLVLQPHLYKQGKKPLYVFAVIFFILVIGTIRSYGSWYFYNYYFTEKPEEKFSPDMIVSSVMGMTIVYFMGFPIRMTMAYFKLRKQTASLLLEKSQAELNLLKSKVQPHFLFNTLNNIYYEAYLEAPRTALLIEKLAEMMRYFMEESPREKVMLETEVRFIENYIGLERIRVRHDIQLDFNMEYDGQLMIPPMLLITFVENIFKHGIDKCANENKISISLTTNSEHLLFEAVNHIPDYQSAVKAGLGLKNLTHRLDILYGHKAQLVCGSKDGTYTASLKIPLI